MKTTLLAPVFNSTSQAQALNSNSSLSLKLRQWVMLKEPIAEHILLSVPDLAFTLCLDFALLNYLTWYPMETAHSSLIISLKESLKGSIFVWETLLLKMLCFTL